MSSHRLRFLLIALLNVVLIAGLVAAAAFGAAESVITALAGALALAAPAFLDASVVERRRKDPTKATIGDDVHTMEVRLEDIEPTPVHRKVRHVPPDYKL